MRSELWHAQEEGPWQRLEQADSLCLSRDGWLVAGAAPSRAGRDLIVVALAIPRSGARAAVIVPDELDSAALRNGVRLRAGLHLLRHGDGLAFAGRRVWIAASSRPEHTHYQAALHGADLHCLRTKARLVEGEPIVVCPGTPDVACGMVYRAAAWDGALRCHHCTFDPRTPPASPPGPMEKRSAGLERWRPRD